MSLLALLMLLAAMPEAETAGSVDGPFLWADVRGSSDETQYASVPEGVLTSLTGTVASGLSVLGQGQLSGGWGSASAADIWR